MDQRGGEKRKEDIEFFVEEIFGEVAESARGFEGMEVMVACGGGVGFVGDGLFEFFLIDSVESIEGTLGLGSVCAKCFASGGDGLFGHRGFGFAEDAFGLPSEPLDQAD